MARSTAGTGTAGAYLVAAELSIREWAAAVTFGNAPRTDVLAQGGPLQIPVAIQVKTKSEHSKDFHLGGISERSPAGANEWVVLVSLKDPGPHDFYARPRDHAWATVQATMPDNTRGLIGPQEFPDYQGRWDLLEQPAQSVEWKVQSWVRDSWKELPWHEGAEPERR